MSEFPALPYCCDHSVQMSKKASVATAANKKAKSSYFSVFFESLRVVLDVEVIPYLCEDDLVPKLYLDSQLWKRL